MGRPNLMQRVRTYGDSQPLAAEETNAGEGEVMGSLPTASRSSKAVSDHECFRRMDETLHLRGEQLHRENGEVRIGVVRIPGRASRPPRPLVAPLVAMFCPFCGLELHSPLSGVKRKA